MHVAVIAILLGLTDGDRLLPRQRAEEPFEVGRVLTRGIDAHVEMDRSTFLLNLLECPAELGVPLGRLSEGERVGGRLQIRAQERDMVSVARRVETDADGDRGRRSHATLPSGINECGGQS